VGASRGGDLSTFYLPGYIYGYIVVAMKELLILMVALIPVLLVLWVASAIIGVFGWVVGGIIILFLFFR